ncbi:MAG: diaminobutyrate acetyltransferase [Pirellulaceae bacterium]
MSAVAAMEPAICSSIVRAESLPAKPTNETEALAIRTAKVDDAASMWQLVDGSGVLDLNSRYCYLLLCREFSDTCLVATLRNRVVGFVTAFRSPQRPHTLFVWQIGVDAALRGQGVAGQLLDSLTSLALGEPIRFLEATVTPSNTASRRLFQSFAGRHGVPCRIEAGFTSEMLGGQHEAEQLFRIGPFPETMHRG